MQLAVDRIKKLKLNDLRQKVGFKRRRGKYTENSLIRCLALIEILDLPTVSKVLVTLKRYSALQRACGLRGVPSKSTLSLFAQQVRIVIDPEEREEGIFVRLVEKEMHFIIKVLNNIGLEEATVPTRGEWKIISDIIIYLSAKIP